MDSNGKPYSTLLFGALGVLIVTIIVFFPFLDRGEIDVYKKPQFLTWFLLILMNTSLFSVAAFSQSWQVIQLFRKLKSAGSRWVPWFTVISTIFGFGVLYSIVFVIPMWLDLVPEIPNFEPSPIRTAFIVTGGGLAAIPTVISISLLHAYLRLSFCDPVKREDIDRYLEIRGGLQWNLLILGVIIGLSTAAIGALRNLSGAVCEDRMLDTFRDCSSQALDVVYLGAYFTVILALFYLPTSQTLLTVGRRIRDTLLPLPDPGSESWTETYSKRKILEELLQLQIISPQTFQIVGAIFAPTISGIILLVIQQL